MTAATAPYMGKSIFQDSTVKVAVYDVFHIRPQKAILLGEAIIIDLFKCLKVIFDTLIILVKSLDFSVDIPEKYRA